MTAPKSFSELIENTRLLPAATNDSMMLASIAMSLKRIADAMEAALDEPAPQFSTGAALQNQEPA